MSDQGHIHRCGQCTNQVSLFPVPPDDAPLTQYVGMNNALRKVPPRSHFPFARITVNGIKTWTGKPPFGVVEAFRGEEEGWAVVVYYHQIEEWFCRFCGATHCYQLARGKVEIAL